MDSRPRKGRGGRESPPQPPPAAERTLWRAGNLVLPAPAALVSCQAPGSRPNLITVAWCGNINSDPPMLSVSIRPSRHSHGILVETGEFAVNIPSVAQARAVDYCGVVSGRDVDKFAATGLTPAPAGKAACPLAVECPVSLVCRLVDRKPLGSHDLFLAEVTEVSVRADLVDAEGGFRVERADLLCYAHGFYFSLGKRLGHFGWSVRKKAERRKRNNPRR